jgi:hypothetical protein
VCGFGPSSKHAITRRGAFAFLANAQDTTVLLGEEAALRILRARVIARILFRSGAVVTKATSGAQGLLNRAGTNGITAEARVTIASIAITFLRGKVVLAKQAVAVLNACIVAAVTLKDRSGQIQVVAVGRVALAHINWRFLTFRIVRRLRFASIGGHIANADLTIDAKISTVCVDCAASRHSLMSTTAVPANVIRALVTIAAARGAIRLGGSHGACSVRRIAAVRVAWIFRGTAVGDGLESATSSLANFAGAFVIVGAALGAIRLGGSHGAPRSLLLQERNYEIHSRNPHCILHCH